MNLPSTDTRAVQVCVCVVERPLHTLCCLVSQWFSTFELYCEQLLTLEKN